MIWLVTVLATAPLRAFGTEYSQPKRKVNKTVDFCDIFSGKRSTVLWFGILTLNHLGAAMA
jgi:hypothetical protein